MHLPEIQIRDPFIVTDRGHGLYYLYGTTALGAPLEAPQGFVVRTSRDLVGWSDPQPVLTRQAGPAEADYYWAPEVRAYRGKWYLFGTFSNGLDLLKPALRHTSVFIADTPAGPFRPHSELPLTPADWLCIDGTLHVDAAGRPWLVVVREWVQTFDGEIHAIPLSDDLRRAIGKPRRLFRASEAPWSLAQKSDLGDGYRVTDGPWVHRTAGGDLLLLWSSFGDGGYVTGVARSESGEVTGPWVHETRPIYAADGGHPMLFETLAGQLMLAIHTPNRLTLERAKLIPVREVPGGLALG